MGLINSAMTWPVAMIPPFSLRHFFGEAAGVRQQQASPEPRRYLNEPPLRHLENGSLSEPLSWWREHQHTFPQLAGLAKRYLVIMASSASVERAFSKSGWLVSKRRCSMVDDSVGLLTFLSAPQQYLSQ